MPDSRPETSSVEQYFELLQAREELAVKAASATALTQDLYTGALDAAETKLTDLAGNQEVAAYMQETGGTLAAAFQELDDLEVIAEKGLIPAEAIDAKRAELQEQLQDARVAHAVSFVRQSGLIGKQVSVQPAAVPAPELGERVKSSVTLTVLGNSLKIGDRGHMVKISEGTSPQYDYTAIRTSMLKVLADKQGEMLTSTQLWAAAVGDEVPYDSRAMYRIGAWFEKVTFRRSPIVARDRQGGESIFGIMNFQVNIVEKEAPAPEQRVVRVPIEPAAPADPVVPAAEVREVAFYEPKARGEATTEPSLFPLTRYDALTLSAFIDINHDALERAQIDPIDPAVYANLDKMVTDTECAVRLAEYGDLENARRAIIEKARQFFADEDLVLRALDDMSAQDDRYPLFEYLVGLDSDERWQLLEQLITAEHGVEYTVQIGGRGGVELLGARPTLIMGDRDVFAEPTDFRPRTVDEEEDMLSALPLDVLADATLNTLHLNGGTEAPVEEPALEPEEVIEPIPESVPEPAPEPEGEPEPAPEPEIFEDFVHEDVNTAVEFRNPKQFERAYRHQLGRLIDRLADLGLHEGARRDRLQGTLFMWLTTAAVRNAREGGVINRDTEDLYLMDVLKLHAAHVYKDFYQITNRTRRTPHRKMIDNIIKDEIRGFQARLHERIEAGSHTR